MEPAVTGSAISSHLGQLPAHDSGSDSGCSASSTSVGKRAYDKDGILVSVFGSRAPRKPRTHSRTLVGKVFKAWATLIKDIAAAKEISSDVNPWASLV